MCISEVFNERSESYINEFFLYIAHFNQIPHYIEEINIDCEKALDWFTEHYKNEIKDFYYNKRYFLDSKEANLDDVFLFLYEDLLVDFDIAKYQVRFMFRKTEVSKVEELLLKIKAFKKRHRRKIPPLISLLVASPRGIDTISLEITKPKLNIQDNYNDDFLETHSIIFKRLSEKNGKGLVLLHGKPGTGKTSYIRYLIASLKKKIIFLPPNMASAITNPELIAILTKNINSIFVIEDAENIVIDREQDSQSPVSVLLNLSDGLLSDCLNIQIICSFNTDISKIDSALMRKGRLIAKYEFKELEVKKAQQLSSALGFKTVVTKPMSLASIYNQEEREFHQSRVSRPIGFMV